MEYYKLAIVVIWPILAAIKVIYDTRGVCFAGGYMTTDNEKMLHATTKIRFYDWPSKIHSIKGSRAETREYWVFALKFIQLFYKNKTTDHVNFTLALVANCVSSILIYFIMSNYFNSNVGLIVSLLYSTCLWAYQIIFVIGHVHLAQMFFLFTVLFLQMASLLGDTYAVYFYFLAGIFTITSFVSSSASRKYPLFAIIAFVFSLQKFAVFPWEKDYFTSGNIYIFLVSLLIFVFTKTIIKYRNDNIVRILKEITKQNFKKNHVDLYSKIFLNTFLIIAFFGSMFPNFDLITKFLIAYLLGSLTIVLHILLPVLGLKENIRRYIWWLKGTWRSHFPAYPNQEKTFGKKLPDGFRGEGFPWTYRFFWRVVPIIFVLYTFSFLVVAYDAFTDPEFENIFLAMLYIVAVTIVSLFPLIISEITSSLQVGKAYFPSLIGFLIMIGLASDKTLRALNDNQTATMFFFAFAVTVIILQMSLSLYFYFKDVLPARMSATILRNKLKKINAKEIYTYDNGYNNPLVKSMMYSYPREFEVKFIEKIKNVKQGIIVIPGTSSKAESMETQFSMLNGDFRKDEILNELYENKDIEKLALAKIRTRGCSRYFVLESEVTGYRDLILKQISDYDRWIANAWILSAETVHNFIASKNKVVA